MKKSLFGLIFVFLMFFVGLVVVVDYKIDKEGQYVFVNFCIQYFGYSWLYGIFKDFDGIFIFDEKNLVVDKVNVIINIISVDINYVECDKYFCSVDFFNIVKYLQVIFIFISVKKDGDELDIIGDLILNGVIKFVMLEVKLIGQGDDLWGGKCVGFEVEGKIKFKDFNIKIDLGLVFQDVDLIILVEGVQQK